MSPGGFLLLLGLLTPWAELTTVPSNKLISICDLPVEIGPCKAHVTRFYYNRGSNECREFAYGGCQGNANNFETKEECQKSCAEKPGLCPQDSLQRPCIEKCHNDQNCHGEQKCCRYGCRSECKDPIFVAFGSPTKRPSRIGSTVRT